MAKVLIRHGSVEVDFEVFLPPGHCVLVLGHCVLVRGLSGLGRGRVVRYPGSRRAEEEEQAQAALADPHRRNASGELRPEPA